MDPETRDEVVSQAISDLSDIDFDAIAVRGFSSALIGPLVAYKMGKAVCVIRKDGEFTHSSYRTEGLMHAKVVFIDDLICSGKTVRTVKERLWQDLSCDLVGVYLYLEPEPDTVIPGIKILNR